MNQTTNSTFIDKCMDFTVEILSKRKNSIILGDFNHQVNDYDDNEAMAFSDMMTSVGLQQWVKFYTHEKAISWTSVI